MNRLIIFLFFISLNATCFADFVDVATIKINNKLVRNVTQNSSSPYLICLSEYSPNDTMSIDVWTDYGGESNSYLTYQNKETNAVDTIRRRKRIILTEEMLTTPHIYSVTFKHFSHGETIHITWDIFETTNDYRIEEAYSCLNLFVAEWKLGFPNPEGFFTDSVACNIESSSLDSGGLRQTNSDTTLISRNELKKRLVLTADEKEYLIDFNAIDYVQHYNLKTRMYGQVTIDFENIEWFTLRIANFSGSRIKFLFVYENNSFKVKSVIV